MKMRENEKIWNFNNWADHYDKTVASDSQLYARYDEVLDMIVEIANVSPGKRVLDIGTGTGNLALRCLARGAKVVGLDPSKRMLAKAREKVGNEPRAKFHQVDAPFLCIPYSDASFDAVVSSYAFHHIPHRLKPDSVREMVRVLKPGGVWALGDLMFENEDAERKALHQYWWLEEEYFARIDKLCSAFTELGMELNARQFTPITWVVWTIKPKEVDRRQTDNTV
jgi:putative AdoMet-dependent methyltransferase